MLLKCAGWHCASVVLALLGAVLLKCGVWLGAVLIKWNWLVLCSSRVGCCAHRVVRLLVKCRALCSQVWAWLAPCLSNG